MNLPFLFSLLASIPGVQSDRTIMDEVISVFENGTVALQYDYIEQLQDGRGYTAGRAGFTTATGDLELVVAEYLKINPTSALQSLQPILIKLAKEHNAAIDQLSTLPDLWKMAALDPKFRAIQDAVVDHEYFSPALTEAQANGFKSALGILCIYDAIIQEGNGEDPDGLPALLKKLKSSYASESDLILDFLSLRRNELLHPTDPTTAAAWSESVGRVDALIELAKEQNFSLKTPFKINPYGFPVTIE